VAGVDLPVGAKVGMLFGCGNYDPATFDRPHEFVLDRRLNPHLAWGAGVHRCVGEPLARLMLTTVISTVLARVPDYELVNPGSPAWQVGYARELESLPVTFTPGTRSTPDPTAD